MIASEYVQAYIARMIARMEGDDDPFARLDEHFGDLSYRLQHLSDRLDQAIARLDQQNATSALTAARYARILETLQDQGQDGNARVISALRAQARASAAAE